RLHHLCQHIAGITLAATQAKEASTQRDRILRAPKTLGDVGVAVPVKKHFAHNLVFLRRPLAAILAHVTHDEFPVTVVNRRRPPAQFSGDFAVRQLADVLKQEAILFRRKPALLRRFHHVADGQSNHPPAFTLPKTRKASLGKNTMPPRLIFGPSYSRFTASSSSSLAQSTSPVSSS